MTFSFSESRRGFVLLEAVVALAIIGLVAIALLSTTSSQLRTASKATVLLTARSLAEDRIAAIRFLNYDDLSRLPDSLVAGRFPPPFDAFEWTTVVEEMEDEYDLFGAEVVVNGLGESFPLRTLVHAPRPVLTGGATEAGRRGGEPAVGRGGRGGDAAPGRGGRDGGFGRDTGAGRGGDAGRGRGGAQVGRGGRGGGGRIESNEAAAVSPAMTAVRTTPASGVR
ncbi:MAG TPA: type II secretion system protein [Longimicrobiales bacterium]|nr:type II secretion system protein [Longimicrobiales bacterium]